MNTVPDVTETDIQLLPDPVQKYLRYVGVIGKPKVNNFRLVFSGEIKQKMGAKWMDISSLKSIDLLAINSLTSFFVNFMNTLLVIRVNLTNWRSR